MFSAYFIFVEVCKKFIVDGIYNRTIGFYRWVSLWRRIWNKLWLMRLVSVATGIFMITGGVIVATIPDKGKWCSIFLFIPSVFFIIAPYYFKKKIDKAV